MNHDYNIEEEILYLHDGEDRRQCRLCYRIRPLTPKWKLCKECNEDMERIIKEYRLKPIPKTFPNED